MSTSNIHIVSRVTRNISTVTAIQPDTYLPCLLQIVLRKQSGYISLSVYIERMRLFELGIFVYRPVDEYVDIETLDHSPPLYFSSEKLNEQLDKSDPREYDANWMDRVDKLVSRLKWLLLVKFMSSTVDA